MIGNTTVVCEPQVKYLGVISDQVLSMRQHVNYTSRTARFHLRNISRNRSYIPEESCNLVMQSLVTSRLDYSNGLLYGIPKSAVSILQSSKFCCSYCHQDCSEGTYNTRSQRATLVPVDRRIEYKMLLYTYKALNGLAPEYLCNMVESSAPDRVLRSANQNLLVVPRRKHCQYGIRTFSMAAAATLWNSLNIRDRGNRVRGSPSLESFKVILRLFFLRNISTPFLLDLNIWAYLLITCRISVFFYLDFSDCLAMIYHVLSFYVVSFQRSRVYYRALYKYGILLLASKTFNKG